MDKERIDDLGINGKKIIQNTDYFCFGIDSVLLANFVESNSSKNNIVDLCSGSGVISVIVSQKKKCNKIYALELQNEMYDLLDRNVKINSLEEKIIPLKGDVKSFSMKEKVDIVVSNPPYKEVGTGVENTNTVKYIARHEKECTLEDIFKCSSKLLKQKGKLYLVHKPQRIPDLISEARKYKLEPKKMRLVYPTINSKPSIVLMEYVYFGGNELEVLSPLIEYNENGEYTKEIFEIYGMGENK
ncbi:MAG: tRNA1(Val) (adenine(37)-N6)-methyltransferase [Clostridia bacterium]|nr:tRNA1(Val) (adenine(37)-N6)-methyltransferase [Clostridia bacterium]